MVVARRLFLLVVFVGVLWLGWQFASANADRVSVDLLALRFSDVSLWLVLLVSFALGVVVAGFFVMLEIVRSGLRTRRYRKAVAKLEAEVHQLRNLPVAAADSPVAGDFAPGAEARPAS